MCVCVCVCGQILVCPVVAKTGKFLDEEFGERSKYRKGIRKITTIILSCFSNLLPF